ncbi:FliM/FliN family flagellar motor switch protein [Burkholderia cenocepacia]|uniref:FliM/FliN family flagellar motor C-terminal domain-containing protein n=1 Tax=Burkholderia TaxID=32008 RepID=UPI00158A26EB|nr:MULTISPECIES: FliM/FliN family flagellar motor switch protein [Burkholderia]MBR8210781.1 FliM/FliN family flagellar motor switch protein [Burkholderia cenocepacia]
MSVGPVTWRPAGNRDPDLARALFETALSDWQSRWFGRTCFSLGDVASLPGTPPEPDARAQTSHWCAPGVRIDMSERSDRRLIDAAFAAGGHAFDNPSCHDFLASIAAEIRDDLIASLCASPASSHTASAPAGNDVPAAAASFSGYGLFRLAIVAPDGDALALLFCDVRHIWNNGASDARTTPRSGIDIGLTPRRIALDTCQVALSVRLGRCELSAAQLTTLSPGDVIVLDRTIDAPATLVVDETSSTVAFGTPGHTGTSLSFKLTSLATPDSP